MADRFFVKNYDTYSLASHLQHTSRSRQSRTSLAAMPPRKLTACCRPRAARRPDGPVRKFDTEILYAAWAARLRRPFSPSLSRPEARSTSEASSGTAVKSKVISRWAVLFSGLNHGPVAGLNVLPPKPVAKANLTSETVSPAKVISSDDRAGRTRLVMSERWPDRAGPELEKTPLEIPHIARQRQA